MTAPNGNDLNAWFQRNKTAVIIAGAVAVLLIAAGSANTGSGGSDGPTDCGQGGAACLPEQPGGDGSGGAPVSGGGSGDGGGFDMDEWRRRQAEEDERQRERVRTIREEERCPNGNVVSIHDGC